jgi:hypothetical protein
MHVSTAGIKVETRLALSSNVTAPEKLCDSSVGGDTAVWEASRTGPNISLRVMFFPSPAAEDANDSRATVLAKLAKRRFRVYASPERRAICPKSIPK